MAVVCHTLGMGRRTGYYVRRERPPGRYQRADDAVVLQQIHAVTNSRATYGYRRVWAMVNRTFRIGYNRKRFRRVMQLHGLMLPPRVHGWAGRPPAGTQIRTLMDRALWTRFGEATLKAPHAIQWLSDNGPQYTATATVLYAHELGLVPITTPAYSPQSNGLAEAFVKTFKRDYVDGAELRDAESVLARLSGWIEDYNTRAPHSALGMRSPADYRAAATLSSSR